MKITLPGTRNVKPAVAEKPDYSPSSVKAALDKAFDTMQKSGVDRIVISVLPGVNPESKNAMGGWINSDAFVYHHQDSLPKAETDMVGKREPYQVVALASDGVMRRQGCSVEIVDRVPVHVMALVNPGRYGKVSDVFVGKEISEFIETNQSQGAISAQEILAAIEPQIAEYKEITARLRANVQNAIDASLQSLANGFRSIAWQPAEDALAQVRRNMRW